MLLEEEMDLVVEVEEELNQLIMPETAGMVLEVLETQMQDRMVVTADMHLMAIEKKMVLAVIQQVVVVMQELAEVVGHLV